MTARISPTDSNSSARNIALSRFLHISDREGYYNFQKSQCSPDLLLGVCNLVSIMSILQVLESGFPTNEFWNQLLFVSRMIRLASNLCCWIHWMQIKLDVPIRPQYMPFDLRNPLVTSQYILLLNSVGGSLIMVVRSELGNCMSGQSSYTCNPESVINGLPMTTVLFNMFLLLLYPTVFKVHSVGAATLSWIITITGFFASCIVAQVNVDYLVASIVSSFCLGLLMYERERDRVLIFLTFQDNNLMFEEKLIVELNKRNEEFEKEQLRNLIGNVAHDLKTPLQAFMSELNNLQMEIDSLAKQIRKQDSVISGRSNATSYLVKLEEMGVCMDSLRDIYHFMIMAINRGIEFRKATTGLALLPSRETFNLLSTVQWAVKKFANHPTGVVIKVVNHTNCDKLCPMIISDKHWLCENIICLTSNACKFTPTGEITIRCTIVTELVGSQTELSKLQILSNSQNCSRGLLRTDSSEFASVVSFENIASLFHAVEPSAVTAENSKSTPEYFVLIEIEDTGIGIAPDKRSTLFRPFCQAQRRAGGTGLGLFSLSKRMQAIGGKCGLSNRRDDLPGSCFWFCVPYVPDLGCLDRSPRNAVVMESTNGLDSPVEYVQETGKVLLVDDSSLILKTTSRMLVKLGYSVEVAQNGAEALNLMMKNKYVFVLSDIQMPIMDGIEATRRIRQHEATTRRVDDKLELCDIENGKGGSAHFIIGMSADYDAQTKTEAFSAGMNDFLSKPIQATDIANCLSRRRSQH
jgi:CheY-like chemotaxis protein